MRKNNATMVISIIAVFLVAAFYLAGTSVAQQKVPLVPKKPAPANNPHHPSNRIHKIPEAKYILHDPSKWSELKASGMGKEIDIPPAAFTPDGWYGDFYGTYFIDWSEFYLTGSDWYPGLQAPIIFPKSAKKLDKIYLFIDDWGAAGSSYVGVYLAPVGSYFTGYEVVWFNTADGAYVYEIDFKPDWKLKPFDSWYISVSPGEAVFHEGIHIVFK